jgi:hypothetical protein
MATVALTGADLIIINSKVISDLADADVASLEFPNNIADVKTGKNGNSIYALNESGKNSELTLRVIRGSGDDKFLNQLLSSQNNNFAGTVLLVGEFVKKVGDGTGKITSDTYVCSGGIFTRFVPAKSNVDGDTGQSVCEYKIKFSNTPRVLT